MIIVPFPMDITGQLEQDICDWVEENAELNELGNAVIFEDGELALYFRLRFGL